MVKRVWKLCAETDEMHLEKCVWFAVSVGVEIERLVFAAKHCKVTEI